MNKDSSTQGCFALVVMFLILIIHGALIITLEVTILGVLGLSVMMMVILSSFMLLLGEAQINEK